MNSKMMIDQVVPSFLKENLSYFATAYFYEGKFVEMISSNLEWQHQWEGGLWKEDPCFLIGMKTTLDSFDWKNLDLDDPLVRERREICEAKSGVTFFLRHGDHLHLTALATKRENDYDLKNERAIFKRIVYPAISLINKKDPMRRFL